MTVKRKISSAQATSNTTGGHGSFDARNTSICDTEDPNIPTEFFSKVFVHLNNLLQNQTGNAAQCTECRWLISGIINCLNMFDSYLLCENCGEMLFGCDNYERSVAENNLPTKHISIHLSYSKTKNIDKKMHILKNKIERLHNNIQHLHGESVRLGNSLQRLSQEWSSLQMNCQQQSTTISEIKSNQDITKQNLLEIKQKIEDLHYASYDGSLMWIIDEFKQKFHKAESGQQTSIYSSIFYSSTFGYNMRARLDLYGDGDARGTHMSIFLVILKGEYDAIITWPFDFPVIFCLFDQSGQGCHIIDAFHPDTRSPSFQRPCSKENIASGILKYCPLAVMKQQGNYYIRNDTMYIKIMVDFLGIPRPILPYTLGLNPGLPTHEQEAQCRIEIEKHEHARAAIVAEMNRNDQEVAQRSLIDSCRPVLVGNRPQPPPSTTHSESMQCEDI